MKIVNDKRAKKQLPPFSTFKITNSLIGLELGLIKDPQQRLLFNKKTYPPQAWWPAVWKLPHYDLNSAFKYSMVAIYRQLASDIGAVEMQNYVEHFTYGNQDISSKLDSFWLNGSLKIWFFYECEVFSICIVIIGYQNGRIFVRSSLEKI